MTQIFQDYVCVYVCVCVCVCVSVCVCFNCFIIIIIVAAFSYLSHEPCKSALFYIVYAILQMYMFLILLAFCIQQRKI